MRKCWQKERTAREGHWEAKSFRGSCYSRFLNERARGEAA